MTESKQKDNNASFDDTWFDRLQGSTVGFLLLQRFSVGFAVVFISVLNLDLYLLFWCIDG